MANLKYLKFSSANMYVLSEKVFLNEKWLAAHILKSHKVEEYVDLYFQVVFLGYKREI